MNRTDLQALAITRLTEAKSLLAAGHPSGAYYLAGYAVECALKAVIAKRTRQHDFPDKQDVLDSYIHDLRRLAKPARLAELLQKQIETNIPFRQNWRTVSSWSEASRYETYDQAMAGDMIAAVEDFTEGVLPWIMQYW